MASPSGPARRAGAVQGITLGIANACPTFVTAGTVPILPKLAEHYAAVPGSAALVPLVMALPMLMLALCSPVAGLIVDRLGARRVLIASTLAYVLCAPAFYLTEALVPLLVWRAVAGISLAGLVIGANALLAGYFDGAARERWIGAQMVSISVLTVFTGLVAGALGDINWRLVFLLPAVMALALPVYLLFTWDVAPTRSPVDIQAAPTEAFPWLTALAICALTTLYCSLLFVPLFDAGFLLNDRGIHAATYAGIATALGALGGIPGSAAFGIATRLSVPIKIAIGYALMTAAFCVLRLPGLAGVLVCTTMIGMAMSFGIATLTSWMMSALPPVYRGRGLGAWQTSLFLGQFAAPQIAPLVARLAGGWGAAMWWYAAAVGGLTLLAFVIGLGPRRHLTQLSPTA